ncbi:unnamed protein product [Spirodela intermedia]|uniref:Uncharacterized protein n=1 Tax=Spirodela intermedia TaxID=51605 RepID=A0A7I8KPE9_SPIIN|nr:unnamed protein product [Spirodela intermedia]
MKGRGGGGAGSNTFLIWSTRGGWWQRQLPVTSGVSDLVDLARFGAGELTDYPGVGDRGLPVGEGRHVLLEELFRELPDHVALLIPIPIQEGKVRDSLHTELIELLLPLGVVHVQHHKVNPAPEKKKKSSRQTSHQSA